MLNDTAWMQSAKSRLWETIQQMMWILQLEGRKGEWGGEGERDTLLQASYSFSAVPSTLPQYLNEPTSPILKNCPVLPAPIVNITS